MLSFSPLSLIGTVSENNDIEKPDIVVTKRSLQRVGHYSTDEPKFTEMTDDGMFAGIRSFQDEQKLSIDGRMVPDGETATSFGKILGTKTPRTFVAQNDRKNDEPTDEQCDHLYWNIDIPTCRAILAKRGKRGAARCFHTATFRYSLCLQGRPMNELPPLDTWVP
jgi:hypothetical protein